jgi:predicted transposase/invertase (TIGR01784 family)
LSNKIDKEKPATPDILWKKIIKRFFVEFLDFFMPELLKDIIPEKSVFLDKELLSITGKQKKGIIDILVKVYLKNGKEEYILFHIEIQGTKQDNFGERMFRYYIRIWDVYLKPVISLALLVDRAKNTEISNVFTIDSYSTKLKYEYKIINIGKLNYENCINSKNPIEVALSVMIKDTDEPLWKIRGKVEKRLYELGLNPEDIYLLIAFVGRLVPLKGKNLINFKKYLIEIQNEVPMIMTDYEERALKKGKREGLKEGKKEKGFEIAKNMLKKGINEKLISEIVGIDSKEIGRLKKN